MAAVLVPGDETKAVAGARREASIVIFMAHRGTRRRGIFFVVVSQVSEKILLRLTRGSAHTKKI